MAEIWVVGADGSHAKKLFGLPYRCPSLGPTWSPDGTKITFAFAREGRPKLYEMNADGSGVRMLTTVPFTNDLGPASDGPAWRPVP